MRCGRSVLILAAAFVWSCTALACSIPVFRYALERWPAEPFQVVVFHRGELDKDAAAFINALNQAAAGDASRANVHAVAVSVDKELPEEYRALWPQVKTEDLPLAVALFPEDRPPAWSGKPTLENAKKLLDSPARAKITEDIMKGASAVWVLVESGNPQKDAQARALLAKTLANVEKTFELPEILPEDRERFMAAGGPELKVWFPVLIVSRSDPQEQLFIQIVTRTEEQIPAAEPVAFPIFGQGRSLGAFHGELLNADEIAGACGFLVGMCSCQAKEMNPGTDLLFTAGWHRFLADGMELAPVMPELIGTPPTLRSEQAPPEAPPAKVEPAVSKRPPAEAKPGKPKASGGAVLRNVLIAAGAGVLCVALLSLVLWRKRKTV